MNQHCDFGVVSMIAIALTISYVTDRSLASRFAGIASTLIFPLACVAVFKGRHFDQEIIVLFVRGI
jgi:hypothetical protein